jgi:DNA polymerase III subunit beta
MESLLEQRQQNELEVKEDVAVTSEMAFVVDHGALMNALTICWKVIPKSSAIPIMLTIKFDLNGDTLFITAVDVSQSVLQMMEV